MGSTWHHVRCGHCRERRKSSQNGLGGTARCSSDNCLDCLIECDDHGSILPPHAAEGHWENRSGRRCLGSRDLFLLDGWSSRNEDRRNVAALPSLDDCANSWAREATFADRQPASRVPDLCHDPCERSGSQRDGLARQDQEWHNQFVWAKNWGQGEF